MSLQASTSAFSRMAGKFNISFASGCHNWTGSLSSQGKYPTIGRQNSRKVDYAYRVAWEHVNGPVPTTACPDGSWRWELHHKCENKLCVNPHHIELITHDRHMNLHAALRLKLRALREAA